MKHVLLVIFIIGLSILTRAQKQYEVSSDGTHKVIKGIISRDMLETDTAFRWFHDNQNGYTPNAETVSVLKAKGPEVRFVVFGGTGDVSLYVKNGDVPTTSSFDKSSVHVGNSESAVYAVPAAGTYYLLVSGVADFSNVSVQATFVSP